MHALVHVDGAQVHGLVELLLVVVLDDAVLGIEQPAEDRRAVEARPAAPVDRAVPRDQRRGAGVADHDLVLVLPAVQALLRAIGGNVDSFVCGSDGFVEVASDLLMQAGQPGHAIRTERFGPTGG